MASCACQNVEQNRLAIRRGFRNTNISGNDRLVNLIAHELPDILHNLRRQIIARIEHGKNHAMNAQIRIERFLDLINGREKLRQAFKREKLALQRHQNRVSCS